MIENNNNKGITLIALVITIIVMLILAGVVIRVSQTGKIFMYAANAVKETQTLANQESEILESLSIESIASTQLSEKFSSRFEEDTNYTDKNGNTARIPKGFAVGTSSKINTVSGGLVITDHVTSNGVSDGNEFVWIPVDNISDFERTDWSDNNETELDKEFTETENSAYLAMKASVQKWKGFYIARYEAGTTVERGRNATNATNLTPYSKKLLYPYNEINWSSAKLLSEGMYTGNSHFGVTSTLCYGVQWDSIMKFIKNNKNISNSTAWGNYYNNSFNYKGKLYNEIWNGTGIDATFVRFEWTIPQNAIKPSNEPVLIQTGACENNQVKNIYDLAGNLCEWTMETIQSRYVARDGGYVSKGDLHPVSSRLSLDSRALWDVGFRPVLYVTSAN